MIATKILKSKRGVAIENAILFLLVIFMLCALLASITIIANFQFKIDNMVLKNDVDLDQIGEDFIAYLASGETKFDTFLKDAYADETKKEKYNRIYVNGKYGWKIIGNTFTVKTGDTVLLQMISEDNGTVSWRYLTADVREIDQIGTAFIDYLEAGKSEETFDGTHENYDVAMGDSEGKKTLTIKAKDDDEVKLYVEASVTYATDENGVSIVEKVDVLTWRYSAP